MHPRVDAEVRGTDDELFLYTLGNRLGGIEYVAMSEIPPGELPDPAKLLIKPWQSPPR